MRIVAIVAAYNEADVIAQTTRDLIDQGIQVYLLDDGSTDGTPELLEPWIGKGVLAIERLSSVDAGHGTFELRRILERKAALAATLDADWIINHDADELREAPWPGMSFADGVALVDRLGWNAIDFEVLNFWPTADAFPPGGDLREHFSHWAPALETDRLQIRCWKRQSIVDLGSTGGHEAMFEGRRVFPIRFLLRHYPVRSQGHGQRKIFQERVPRFDKSERAEGWHTQYDHLDRDGGFIRSETSLTRFDPEAVRIELALRNRTLEAEQARVRNLDSALREARTQADTADRDIARLKSERDEQATLIESDRATQAGVLASERTAHAAALEQLRLERESLAARLADATAMAERRADAITQLTVALATATVEADDLRHELAEHQRQNDRLREEVATAVSAATSQAAEQAAALSGARQRLESAQHHLDAVLQSKSWRWTAVARRIADALGFK